VAMPFRKETPAPTPPPKAVIASAVNVSKEGARAYHARKGNDQWQREAWYQYDICGELRYAVTWIANAISMATMYVAETDPETGLVTDATENSTVQAIGNSILGGPAHRAQHQATIALNWQIAGEVFLLIRPSRGAEPDEWLVLSSSEISEQSGRFKYEDPDTGALIELNTASDMLIRVWSPHPKKRSHADSAVRASLPTLKEIEKTSQNIAARLDSRLVGSGVWLMPQEVDFPTRSDGSPGVVGFVDEMIDAASMSLSNPGQASAQVPMVVQIPGEHIAAAKDGHIDFSTELSAEILELRTAAIRRLALSLDMPSEIMLGMGESNHWSAWQIEESAYKVHVAPLLDRLGDAITTTYLKPALEAAGVQNPDQYVIAFDTTEIISRPNRFDELKTLHDDVLISDDYFRSESGIPDDAIPADDERNRRLFEQLVKAAPTILVDFPQIAEAIGLNPVQAAQEVSTGPVASQPELEAPTSNTVPQRAQDNADGSVQASAAPLNHLTSAAELLVFDALSRAGGRLLTRSYRGQFQSTPKHELHTAIPFTEADLPRLLEGSFQFADNVASGFGIDHVRFGKIVSEYVSHVLVNRMSHDKSVLRERLWQMTR
jgi:hypothetical protein